MDYNDGDIYSFTYPVLYLEPVVKMQVIADLHLHSKYSRATSKDMDLIHLSEGAKVKGLNLLGTGDLTHPLWFNELKRTFGTGDGTGIFKFKDIFWMLTAEVSTIYTQEGKTHKVHHIFCVPDLESTEQINEELSKHGNLKSDGRPIFAGMTSAELVEILIGINKNVIITPAHAWTPWFSVFGSKSGFNSLEECYQDQIKNIFTLETGLSSDPAMNWRLSNLDKVTIISNSDSHSPNPWRLGREANVFDLEDVTYKEIYETLKKKDKKKFLFTIEVDPNYGKYHFTGHREHEVSMHPKEALKLNNICPVCKKPMTVGVLQRVEELADRPEGFVPKDAIPFKTLLPLYEIISVITGTNALYSKKIIEEQDKLIKNFRNELNVLLNASKEDLIKVTSEKIAEGIIRVREGKVKYVAGYDGEYGRVIFDESQFEKQKKVAKYQKSLSDFN